MDSGLYAAYTGLLARTQALDTAANNLANAGTVGFRAQRDYFRSVLAGMENGSLLRRWATRSTTSACWAGTDRPGTGTVTATGNPLDMALNGPGFFAIQSTQGVQYTRDGGFLRSDTGVLQTAEGEPCSMSAAIQSRFPAARSTLRPDGSISVTTRGGERDRRTGGGLRTFPPGQS